MAGPVAEVDRRVAEWLALLTFAAYAYSFAGGGWNQNSQFDLTRAIVEHRTFAIDAYAINTGDVSYANGHVYSNKSPALSWIAAIPYAALYLAERSRGIDVSAAMPLTFNAYICSLATVALAGCLVPAMLFIAGRRRGFPSSWCAFVALATALATQLFPYATIFMLHVPSGALMLYALTSPRRAVAGFAAGLATAMNYLCAPILAIFALLGGTRRFLAGAAAPLIALAVYQQMCFGSFLTNSMARTDPRFLTPGAKLGVFQAPSLGVFYAITVSSYRGVFFFAPLLVAALGGAIVWWRSRQARRELIAVLATAAFFFAFNLCYNGWDGGFGVGGRYLVPVIPLVGLALLYFRNWMTIALAVVSLAINLTCTVVDPQPSASIPRPLTQYVVPLFVDGRFSPSVPLMRPWSADTLTGHTSVNRMTLDEARIFERHPAGSLEAEWASFNLGEPFTHPGAALSVLPLLLLLAAGFVAIAVKARN